MCSLEKWVESSKVGYMNAWRTKIQERFLSRSYGKCSEAGRVTNSVEFGGKRKIGKVVN